MHSLLVALLVFNTVLHGVVIARFGIKSNEPFLIFAVIYAVLALVVYFAVAYALWATLALSVFGLIGLTVTFNKVARDKTLDRIIWAADAATIAATAYLLFVR